MSTRALRVPGIVAVMPVGQLEGDRVREAEREVQRRALHLGAIAGARQLERLLVALGDALDHAGDERAHQALQARARRARASARA